MDNLLDAHYGLPAICVLLVLQLLFKVGEFLWEVIKKKDEVSEKSISELTASIQKLSLDLRRVFAAVKILAGDDWKHIRKSIMDEEIPHE